MAAGRVLNLSSFAATLAGAGVVHFGPILRAVAVSLQAFSKERFDTATDPWGQPWKPLKKPSKKRGGASAKPLRDTGLLMGSLTARSGQGHTEEYGPTSLVWGSALDRAGWHNEGTRTIPARPFLDVSPQLEERLARLVGNLVVEQLTKALGG